MGRAVRVVWQRRVRRTTTVRHHRRWPLSLGSVVLPLWDPERGVAMADGAIIRTVGELMSSPPITALPSELISDASRRMKEHGVGSVVVIDSESRPIGILTERDLVRFVASGGDSNATKVSEWMTESPGTVGPDEPVVAAFADLSAHGYRHFPVVDDGRHVGVVSLRDM